MSYHYPHHVGKISLAERADAGAAAQPAAGFRGPSAGPAAKILSFARANDGFGPKFAGSIESDEDPSGLKWHEGAALLGALLLPFITAWLIWAALAEAVLARTAAL